MDYVPVILVALIGAGTYSALKDFSRIKRGRRKTKKIRMKARRKSSRKAAKKISKRYTSRFLRRARATTLPMRMYRAHTSKKHLGLKAEDWVAEQEKLKILNRREKK